MYVSNKFDFYSFKSREEAVESLKANGEVLKDHHLRVQLCDDFKKPENSKAIFIGNLPFG